MTCSTSLRVRRMTEFLYVPVVAVVGFAGIGILASDHRRWIPLVVVGVVAMTFAAERLAPHSPRWNLHGPDFGADGLHAVVNESVTALGILAIPVFVDAVSLGSWWPTEAPFAVRLAISVIVLDAGVTMTHWLSHRWAMLWRFHAVHHGARRLYGLNGLMKHPVHLLIETVAGMAPLIVLGIDAATASALAGFVAVQLVLQHANVDYRVGPLGRWMAWNAGHRLHHVADEIEGNVNFGLFTLVWDRLLGTYRVSDRSNPPPTVGLAGHTPMPSSYRKQFAMPWARVGGA